MVSRKRASTKAPAVDSSDDELPVNHRQRTKMLRTETRPVPADDDSKDSEDSEDFEVSETPASSMPPPEISEGGTGLDANEEEAIKDSCMSLNVNSADLFSTELSNKGIQDLVAGVIPELGRQRPHMIELQQKLKVLLKTAPPLRFPDIEENPTDWPSINLTMDVLWAQAVDGEQVVLSSGISSPASVSTKARTPCQAIWLPWRSASDPLVIPNS